MGSHRYPWVAPYSLEYALYNIKRYMTEGTQTTPLPEIEESVIDKIRRRRDFGRKKYGTTMERTDVTRAGWITHAQEEALDAAIYLERLGRGESQWRALAERAYNIFSLAIANSTLHHSEVAKWRDDFNAQLAKEKE